MATPYIIDGPTQIGTVAQLNNLVGDVRLSNVTSTLGDMVYANASNNLTSVGIGANGTVLTVVAGVPAWQGFATVETGFTARKDVLPALTTAAPFTDVVIDDWVTATAPEFDTTGGEFVASTGIYTAVSGGTVNARCGVTMSSTANSGSRSVSLAFNGAAAFTATAQAAANGTIPVYLTVGASMSLVATDTVSVIHSSTATSGSSTVVPGASTWFSITKNFTP